MQGCRRGGDILGAGFEETNGACPQELPMLPDALAEVQGKGHLDRAIFVIT